MKKFLRWAVARMPEKAACVIIETFGKKVFYVFDGCETLNDGNCFSSEKEAMNFADTYHAKTGRTSMIYPAYYL